MRILHLTEKDYKTSIWSGGTTTELFIWPANADYAKREFAVRVSSATVDLPESDFTPLSGVDRWITPLSGGFTLTHPGKAPVVLAPLDGPYAFSGSEATHCVGKASDFNLMCKGPAGSMTICRDSAPIAPGITCIYALEAGILQLEGNHAMGQGDLLVVFSNANTSAQMAGMAAIVCHAEVNPWENF